MTERVCMLTASASHFGILTEPAEGVEPRAQAVLLLNAGLLHRVGPNRVYVKLARRLAAAGFSVLRFDFSGIGDGPSRQDDLPFHESSIAETRQAMDAVARAKGVERFALIGLCSGGDVAFQTACAEPRVTDLIMINGTGLDAATQQALMPAAEDRIQARYHRRRVFSMQSWKRVLTGKSSLRRILASARAVMSGKAGPAATRSPRCHEPFVQACRDLGARGTRLIMIFSEGSATLDLHRLAMGDGQVDAGAGRPVPIEVIPDADHTFTLLWAQDALTDTIEAWLADSRPAKR